MRDWPLLLVDAAFFIGAAGRYIAEGGSNDVLSSILVCLGSAAFGAWLYSLGVDKERDHPRVRKERDHPRVRKEG